jgi:hypothetical protein
MKQTKKNEKVTRYLMANCTIMRFKAWPAIRSFDTAAIPKMNVPFQLQQYLELGNQVSPENVA